MWVLAGLAALASLLGRRRRRPAATPRPDPLPGESMPASARPRTVTVTVTLLTAALAVSIAQTIVIPALTAFQRELRVGPTTATWALTAFMLASAVATPLAGRLGDTHGHRRVLWVCVAALAVGTLLATVASSTDSAPLLLVGRAVAGVGGGAFPVAFGLARRELPAAQVPGVVAALSAVFGIGGALGMVVAGPLVQLGGLPALSWPVLLLALAAGALIPALPAGAPLGEPGARVDLVGAALLSVGLVAVLLLTGQLGRWGASTAVLLVAAVVAAGLFALAQRRVRNPLVPPATMSRAGVPALTAITVLLGAALFGMITLLPRFAQADPLGAFGRISPSGLSVLLVPVAASMLVATPLAARLAGRGGALSGLRLGCALSALTALLLALVHARLWQLAGAGVLLGAAYGLVFASLGTLVVGAVDLRETGIATAVNTIARTVGGALGAQVAVAVLVAATPVLGPSVRGYVVGFVVLALVSAAALVVTLRPSLRATAGRASTVVGPAAP